MLAFSRLTSILLFVLSLSFLTCALPSPAPQTNALAARGTGDDLLKICADLVVDVKAKVDVIIKLDIKVLADVEAHVVAIVDTVTIAAKAISNIGANVDLEADAKAQVAVHIAVVIKVMVNLCLTLIAKLGVTVILALLVTIDVCLHLLLENLSIAVEGILVLIAKLCVDITAQVFFNCHLDLCMKVLGFTL